MSAIALSNGTLIHSENIEKAEFYPVDSLATYGCHIGGPEMRDCPFLFIQMHDGVARVNGEAAASDAKVLEQAGVRVIRHPVEKRDPPL
jgi:hypothetical protein